jgi:hypothetical protein
MDPLDLLRAKLATWTPQDEPEYQCANCTEYNREPVCWYCGLTREVS